MEQLPSLKTVSVQRFIDSFRGQWCADEYLRAGEWTLCATYPRSSGGYDVEVFAFLKAGTPNIVSFKVVAKPNPADKLEGFALAVGSDWQAADVSESIALGWLRPISADSSG